MVNSDRDSPPPDELPDALVERIDSLEIPELRAVRSYVDGRIDSLRTPIEEEIAATAAGEVLDVDTHGAYALVRMRMPEPDDVDATADLVSLYHVRREERLDGSESLHWTYLGDVQNSGQIECDACGRARSQTVSVCPYCGHRRTENSGTEG